MVGLSSPRASGAAGVRPQLGISTGLCGQAWRRLREAGGAEAGGAEAGSPLLASQQGPPSRRPPVLGCPSPLTWPREVLLLLGWQELA